MSSSYTRKKVRPATASGIIQSSTIPHILDDLRPNTVIGKTKEVVTGLEPTYITANKQIGNRLGYNSAYTGKQVHGGIDEDSFKDKIGRRATLGAVENLDLLTEDNQPKRPLTVRNNLHSIKIEERITLEHLNKMKKAFEEADEDGSGTLDLEEFKNVFKYFLGLKGANEHQMKALFMKIDSSSDGEINWDEFCTYMQLEYTEKEESYFRAKETAFYLPATVENSPHRDTVLRVTHTSDNTFLTIGQDGFVSFWTPNMVFKRTKQVESGSKKSKWITDFISMPQYNKFIIATGDREIQFHELSTFEAYCQISGLETVPLTLDYCFTGSDDCLLLYGDCEGCVTIFVIKNVGEMLRSWKKMPKVEGIASISIDSVCMSENVKFVRWKVHNDWVQELHYYHSIRSVISCSTDTSHSLVIGQALGSTYVSNQSKLQATISTMKEVHLKRRLAADETVFRIYKGVKTFDFSKMKNVLVTGGMDRLIRLWNPYVPTKPIGILRGHVTPIFYLFIVEEDNRLFSISNDKTVKVWDIHDQACLVTVTPKSHLIKGDLTAVHYNPISRGLALATDHIALLRLKNKPLSMQLTTTHKEAVTTCCYNSSFNHVVTASENSVIKVWDVENGGQVFEYSKAHGAMSITAMCFDSTQRRLVTGGRDGKIKIWNYNNGQCLNTLQTDENSKEVSSLVYFTINKNRYIVSVGWDRRINLYSDDQNILHHIKNPYIRWPDDVPSRAHKEDILCISYSPPHFLATSSYDGEVLIWNVTSGRIFCRLRTSEMENASHVELLSGDLSVSKVLFLPKRSQNRQSASLVTNGPKAQINFWNIFDSNKPYATFYINEKRVVSSMITNKDNQLLFTADEKGYIMAWDIENYCLNGTESKPPEVYSSWRAHIQCVSCLCFVEEHQCLLTSSLDCTVRLWTLNGHFIGTFGQPKMWDIYDASTFQHPMAPYDVLMDPGSLPEISAEIISAESDDEVTAEENGTDKKSYSTDKKKTSEDIDVKALLESSIENGKTCGKRLRHAKLKSQEKESSTSGAQQLSGTCAYKFLRYHELEEVPPVLES
ncbi:WD repeat-containing protein on Y chromosome-like isoform X1 [Hydractinia symbiolongicarpus]|uniref:WD repeat-containing protein on Y chromosome-like isoform X1 n=2 Tax=Hydractinia symbiolongicarpus TaxID=13093 RepID=UPI002549E3DC|nr:WD repeat-containing protein on Y chromosome-like isoform X1 [Hydractinia symbiolongicarpus]XP_057313414.1 WD repeat-containing protein on Y chromosome-like isoform X1 [Hydractinia symbiolongicarpus]